MIKISNLTKKYYLNREKRVLLRTFLFSWLKNSQEEIFALKDINLSVVRGQMVGIIGENGSGKSTLLKMISGISAPTSGKIEVDGKIAALLEIGAGFHPDLTGRENIYLSGSLLGLSKKKIDEKIKEIIDFSELNDFIDTPIRNYSSGMFVRLGFSVAISFKPDILVIDEVLAVGDEAFQRECVKKIKDFKEAGKTIFFVSHDLDLICEFCDRVILLKKIGRASCRERV